MKFLAFILLLFSPALALSDSNPVMLQYFHWFTPNHGNHWREIEQNASSLAAAGFTSLWLPPATKGMSGVQDVGYGLYDLYDLGEFDQKGAVRTKYGTKSEYLGAIASAHRAGLKVYSDLILNHMGGADDLEWVKAVRVDPSNRLREIGPELTIQAWTRFLFPRRQGVYSGFTWKWYHFNGTDWDQSQKQSAIFLFRGEHKRWDWDVDSENGNYDYLLLNDLDLEHPEVRAELKSWGRWFASTTQIDGFRIDAAKHTQFEFTREWLEDLEQQFSKQFFAVGEYWTHDLNKLRSYIHKTGGRVSLFDFALQDHLAQASRERGYYDLRSLFSGTLVEAEPTRAVTFADNHDTQRHFQRVARIEDWFKPLAYAFLLLRRDGYPCVFYPDYFGAKYSVANTEAGTRAVAYASFRRSLDLLLAIRRDFAHGPQHDYFDDRDIVGWTREGDAQHPKALAVVISDNMSTQGGGQKRMYVGRKGNSPRVFKDANGGFSTTVTIDETGHGVFPVKNASDQVLGQSVAIWVEI